MVIMSVQDVLVVVRECLKGLKRKSIDSANSLGMVRKLYENIEKVCK